MTDVNADLQSPASSPPAEANQANGSGRASRDRTSARAASAKRWPLSRIIGVALLILLLFSVAAMVAGGIALLNLHDNRQRVIGTLDPAALQAQQLDIALVDQETGVRGYALSAQLDFLAPYTNGVTEERNAIKALQAVIKQLPPSAAADLGERDHTGTVLARPLCRSRPSTRSAAAGSPWSARHPDRQGGFRCPARQDSRISGGYLGRQGQCGRGPERLGHRAGRRVHRGRGRPGRDRGAPRARPAGGGDQAVAPAGGGGPPGGRR